ncbi:MULTISPECIES: ABC transporter permease [Anaerotruncus]|jgi:sugar ABC transporter, ATP binding protein|uniref:ABC transporter permease n=5 Tax=Anaerotruncus TaxID=244127 RepID=A0A498D0M9_9FIRM|nr:MULTISPECIES: ABC transporter permease [Anaerotruncus]MBC3938780.1 ABC transporter permease [Anaerotruncus massiliensis (ex Togo et al. 2019)]MCQ4895880.1 ABC transporter permease [Anaerotruncus sp. DFI.9.16]RLL11035.1 ABC transporter permease [Anaerotruncus massiliensis (ex Liu et al. 2021)]GKH46477.1 ribose ABC transporter permease [Oscillospiraceae bacterium]
MGNTAKKLNIQKLLAPAALVILYIFFCFFGKNFFSAGTLVSILDSTYYVGMMAFGITFVIITGGIDLSIGTNMMMSALIAGYLYTKGVNIWLCLVVIVIIATFVGFINGTLVSRLKLPPFIATLGMMMMTQGFGSIITKVQTQRFPSGFDADGGYKAVFYKTPGGFPSGIVYMLVFFLIAMLLLNKTRFGRYTYAIGSNEESVRLSGVNVIKWKTLVYTVCGFFCGLSAIVYAATYTTIIPGTGNGLEMNAIAAVIIGGTSMSGGIGTMSGTLIGALLMSVLKTGLMSMGLQGHFQTFFTGLVVILAVLLDIYRNKKASAAK